MGGAGATDAGRRAGDEGKAWHRRDDTLSRWISSPVQRVCPHCARISYDSGRRCPYCGRGYRRSVVLPIATMLTVFAVIVLGGVYLMLVAFGTEMDDTLDSEVQRVERELDQAQLRRHAGQRPRGARPAAAGAYPSP